MTLLARAAPSGKHDNTKVTPIDPITRDLMANTSFDVEQNFDIYLNLKRKTRGRELTRGSPHNFIRSQNLESTVKPDYLQPHTRRPLNHQQLQRRWRRTTTTWAFSTKLFGCMAFIVECPWHRCGDVRNRRNARDDDCRPRPLRTMRFKIARRAILIHQRSPKLLTLDR